MIDTASWTCDVNRIALRDSESTIYIEVRAALHAVAATDSFEWIIKVNVGIFGSTRSDVAADSLIIADGFVDVVRVTINVCMNGAVNHTCDIQQEQQAAQEISIPSMVLI